VTAAATRRRRRALTVRRATARDASAICELIHGLARYERLARECVVAPAAVRRHGFGRRRYFETLVCRDRGRPIGVAIYFFTYSTFAGRPILYLEDLFVVPDARGQGAGRALLRALARIAVRRGCGSMDWAVLDWNTPSIAFYRRLGARFRKQWVLTRLAGTSLRRLAR
jgi:GNAT superfamily N-acetyltransferase